MNEEMIEEQFTNRFNSQQQFLMVWRRIQLAVGSITLFYIIISIIRKKLYVYNTTKLFMWCCICYFMGMFIVVFYTEVLAGWNKFAYHDQQNKESSQYILSILNQSKGKSYQFFCGASSFINLCFYDLGYFFAVLVSYNVYCVIHDNYRNFMKQVFRSKIIIAFLCFIIFMYLLPFIFIYIPSNQNQNFWYAYAPMGHFFKTKVNGIEKEAELLLFCGFQYQPGSVLYQDLTIINVYVCALLMLIVHILILCANGRRIKQFIGEEYLNSKQRFIIESGKLGVIVFTIQSLHFVKLILGLIINDGYYFILVINFIFDSYPLVLLYFYLRYTKQKQRGQQAESLMTQQ